MNVRECMCVCVWVYSSQKAKGRKNLTALIRRSNKSIVYLTLCMRIWDWQKSEKLRLNSSKQHTNIQAAVVAVATPAHTYTYKCTHAHIRKDTHTQQKHTHTLSNTLLCYWFLTVSERIYWIQVKAIHNQDTTRGHCRCHFQFGLKKTTIRIIHLIWITNQF